MCEPSRPIPELTRSIASGDAEAFASFYEAYFDEMYAMARRASRADEATCLDIVQESMLRVIRSIPTLPGEPALRGWLRRTVLSCVCDHFRAEARRRRRETAHDAATRATRAARAAETRERLDAVTAALRELDETSATILMLRHRSGWTLARIGALIGLSPGAVDRRERASLRQLRRKLPRSEGDLP